ncbi:MAG TPA: hypothetical protein DDZ80_30180 [Cyanobacteria bacterium UBA8803]|nr:hypothetical protein [Cyanobacteria bacterium UBA9273]HBL62502.1 hypothetical protein [Cyanobacteria bacterium UBA8803]
MKSDRNSLKTLRSKTFWLGLILSILALWPWSLPAFARQQRTGRWIEIDLSEQRLIAWNGKTKVRTFIVSTGKRRTPTRVGTFAIRSKLRRTRMRGRGYNVANVPYTMYYSGGYAVHGAYWHNRFGTPVSHGCVNLRVPQARWLYSWAPVGTKVVIHR